MKNAAYLAILLFGATWTAAAQSLPIAVDVDHATFAYDVDRSLVEIYMAFSAPSLTYRLDGQQYRADVPLDMELVYATDAELEGTPSDAVWEEKTDLYFFAPDTVSLTEGQFFVRQARLTAAPGEYELRLRMPVKDRALEVRRDVLVPDYADLQRAGLSDITLATSITSLQDRENPFYKNGLIIQPSANQLFGEGMTRLFYYAEAYHLDTIASPEGEYELLVYVAEANRPQALSDLQRRSTRRARSTDVLVGSFDLKYLPTGSYFLRLVVLDERSEARVEQSRKFFVFNPLTETEPVVSLAASFETGRYAGMPADEVQENILHTRIIASDAEWRRARRIEDLDEQRRFLHDFWQRRDPDPSTPLNEEREDFYVRLQYANQRYSTRSQQGWESDRGQTLIKYGNPGVIEPHLYDRGFKPYEIWQYNNIPGEGQALFIFVDRDGYGEFEMIHSTVAGERKLANWQQEIIEGY